MKNYQVKPINLNQQQYINTQWKLNPLLKVVNSNVSIQRDEFILLLTIKDNVKLFEDKSEINQALALLDTRYKVALVYRSLLQNDKALDEFNALESEIRETDNLDLLANVYQVQVSILLQQGKKDKALLKVQKAMDMFVQLANLMEQAKTHSIIARIAKTGSDYPTAVTHLKQALNITKRLKHSFGIGATLNELIDTLIEQGKLNEAWKLNQVLEKIAIKIDFTAMLLASKRFTFLIADIKGHAVKAGIYLKEHGEIAQATENKIAMMQNRFMSMSLQLNQGNLDAVNNDLIDLEDFIYQSKESSLKLNYNLVKAQYLFQSKRDDKAQTFLVISKDLAQSSGNFQSMIEINNLLAKVYLKQEKADEALSVFQQSLVYNLPAHPFLLLQSKANNKLNNLTVALNLANQCKHDSFDLWTSKNEQYLSALLTKVKDNK